VEGQKVSYDFLCFDTEDNSKELLAAGFSGFDKAVTQFAAITAEGKRFYVGLLACPFKPNSKNAFSWQRAASKPLVKQAKRWLQQQPEKFRYAHNLQYDMGNLFADTLDCFDATLVGGRLIKAVWGKSIFVDSFNIWPMSAKKIGEAFGLQKLETKSMSTDKEYVFRDVEIIRKAMLFAWQFTEHLGLPHLPPTLGGLCVKVWKHFGGQNCFDSSEMSRAALYGGRVELFKVRNDSKSVCYVDLNSLYPAMMLREFPGPLEKWDKRQLPKFGFVECTIKQPKTALAILPFRNPEGRILYPWGTFRGTWTVAEINAAIAGGAKIIKKHNVMGTDECSKPYVEFVNRLYQARLASNSAGEKLFFKLLMNNLYGRLGSSGKIGRSVWQNEENKLAGVPYGEKVLVEYQMPLSDETNWSHAAYVTAYGRLELFKYLKLIGVEHLIYCDTDSCIFDWPKGVEHPLPFEIGTDLGQMKLESWETACETFAPKMYRIGKKYRAKGVPVALAKQFITRGHVEFDLPFKLREAIRFFDEDNKRKLSVWRQVEKSIKGTYDRKKLVNNRYFPCQVLQK
jgi:DNA polymerase family B